MSRCPQCRMVGCHKMDCTDPSARAPSAQPEMPEGWHFDPAHGGLFYQELPGRQVITLQHIAHLLAAQGLHVITAQQKAVLDAMAALQESDLEYCLSFDHYAPGFMEHAAGAELARRRK